MKVRRRSFRSALLFLVILALQIFPVSLYPSPLPAAPGEAKYARGWRAVPVGRIEISRIGLAAPILEGTDAETLKHAVGHFTSTPLPGHIGNVALAAHRDTFFKALRDIRDGDEISLRTSEGSYRYRVDSTLVVQPEHVEVLDPTDKPILTLVTCYPFNLKGQNAPERFIVRAHQI